MRKKIMDFMRMALYTLVPRRIILKVMHDRVYGDLLTKLVPNHNQFKSPTPITAIRCGVRFHLDISDMVDWFIYFGFKDPARDLLLKSISKGNVVIDVGGNVGEVTLKSAMKVGEVGQIHTFEPNCVNYKRLERNLKSNPFQNVTINQCAIGAEIGEVRLEITDMQNLGATRISHSKESVEAVPLTTLDQYIGDSNLEQIDLIKVDVEGYELQVLNGASKSIKKFRPTLFFELDSENLKHFNSSANELLAEIENSSYKIMDARDGTELSSEMDFTNCHLDIIAHPY